MVNFLKFPTKENVFAMDAKEKVEPTRKNAVSAKESNRFCLSLRGMVEKMMMLGPGMY